MSKTEKKTEKSKRELVKERKVEEAEEFIKAVNNMCNPEEMVDLLKECCLENNIKIRNCSKASTFVSRLLTFCQNTDQILSLPSDHFVVYPRLNEVTRYDSETWRDVVEGKPSFMRIEKFIEELGGEVDKEIKYDLKALKKERKKYENLTLKLQKKEDKLVKKAKEVTQIRGKFADSIRGVRNRKHELNIQFKRYQEKLRIRFQKKEEDLKKKALSQTKVINPLINPMGINPMRFGFGRIPSGFSNPSYHSGQFGNRLGFAGGNGCIGVGGGNGYVAGGSSFAESQKKPLEINENSERSGANQKDKFDEKKILFENSDDEEDPLFEESTELLGQIGKLSGYGDGTKWVGSKYGGGVTIHIPGDYEKEQKRKKRERDYDDLDEIEEGSKKKKRKL